MNKFRKGFTLAELAVAVSITGIMVSLAVSHVALYWRSAKDTNAISQIASIGSSFNVYMADNINTTTLSAVGIQYDPDGTVTVSGGTAAQLAPGFKHSRGVGISLVGTNRGNFQILASHCKGSITNGLYGNVISCFRRNTGQSGYAYQGKIEKLNYGCFPYATSGSSCPSGVS